MAQTIPDGSAVWIKDPDKGSTEAFIKSSVKSFLPGRGYTVTMPDGKEKMLRPVDVAMANPEGMTQPDNCYLIHISESTILDNMRLRFKKSKAIYTYTGSILLAVNPFEMLPIYGTDKMEPYKNRPLGAVEPHTYAMAEEAYKTLLKTKSSQSLVVSGESGAGKTETNKVRRRGPPRWAAAHALHQRAAVAASATPLHRARLLAPPCSARAPLLPWRRRLCVCRCDACGACLSACAAPDAIPGLPLQERRAAHRPLHGHPPVQPCARGLR